MKTRYICTEKERNGCAKKKKHWKLIVEKLKIKKKYEEWIRNIKS